MRRRFSDVKNRECKGQDERETARPDSETIGSDEEGMDISRVCCCQAVLMRVRNILWIVWERL